MKKLEMNGFYLPETVSLLAIFAQKQKCIVSNYQCFQPSILLLVRFFSTINLKKMASSNKKDRDFFLFYSTIKRDRDVNKFFASNKFTPVIIQKGFFSQSITRVHIDLKREFESHITTQAVILNLDRLRVLNI
jgi:hypothetical protein